MEAGGHRSDLSADERDRMTSAEIFELLARIEEAAQNLRLYVADALLQPEGNDSDGGE